uniref:Uncharacterized protein n=1 Tax=Panagrolaimus davidi TaxID=227884 RepID=A0A914PG51_9BILA
MVFILLFSTIIGWQGAVANLFLRLFRTGARAGGRAAGSAVVSRTVSVATLATLRTTISSLPGAAARGATSKGFVYWMIKNKYAIAGETALSVGIEEVIDYIQAHSSKEEVEKYASAEDVEEIEKTVKELMDQNVFSSFFPLTIKMNRHAIGVPKKSFTNEQIFELLNIVFKKQFERVCFFDEIEEKIYTRSSSLAVLFEHAVKNKRVIEFHECPES